MLQLECGVNAMHACFYQACSIATCPNMIFSTSYQNTSVNSATALVMQYVHEHGFSFTGIADLAKLKRFLKDLVDWQSLGLELGLHYPSLEKIKIDYGMVEQCKMKMLSAWLKKEDDVGQVGSPSWKVLQVALRNIGENCLASKIILMVSL